jgi:hypothetical protein
MRNPARESFVPFASGPPPGPPGCGDSRVTVLAQPATAQVFRPATSNPPPGHLPPEPDAPPAKLDKPRITLQRQDGRVMRIAVQCVCGHTIELACVYNEKAER